VAQRTNCCYCSLTSSQAGEARAALLVVQPPGCPPADSLPPACGSTLEQRSLRWCTPGCLGQLPEGREGPQHGLEIRCSDRRREAVDLQACSPWFSTAGVHGTPQTSRKVTE